MRSGTIVTAELGDLIIASMYVPNGGKDYSAKVNFLTRLIEWARDLRTSGRELLLCGDVNIARIEMDVLRAGADDHRLNAALRRCRHLYPHGVALRSSAAPAGFSER